MQTIMWKENWNEFTMENKPLVSIIMGVYNCESTLQEAVNCLFRQTYTNWELIICDDASTDSTYSIALNLKESDIRIQLIKNENNLTLAPTLNRCISIAKGVYIARMDGDDLCENDRLEKEIAFLEHNPQYAMVSCQMNLFDKGGIYRTISHKSEPSAKDLVFRSQFCHAGCVIRKDVLETLEGYNIDKKTQRVEDYDLWLRMYALGYKGYNLQEPLYLMRDDRNAMYRRNFRNRVNESAVKWRVCKTFQLPVIYYMYAMVPILKLIVPTPIYKFAHKRKGA